MYTENERKEINWGIIIKRGLIVVAVLLLLFTLAWIISRLNNLSNAASDEGNQPTNNVTETEKKTLESYSKEFIDNFKYLQDTGRNYFLVNGPLPGNGSSTTLTLGELITKSLILPFSVNGNSCDTENSYIRLTNTNGTYIMSVKLSCGSEQATISEQLGCNQFCEGKNCETTDKPVVDAKPNGNAIQYEYKQSYKVTNTTYTCPAGYIKYGTKCYKNTSDNKKPIEKVYYTCPEGYTLNGTKCISKGETIDAIRKIAYDCSHIANAYLSGSECIVRTTKTATPIKKAKYKCPDSSWTLSGTKCTKRVTTTDYGKVIKSTSYKSCPTGYKPSGSTCYTTTSSIKRRYYSSYQGSISGCTYLGMMRKENCSGCSGWYYTYDCKVTSKKTINRGTTTTYKCLSGYTKSGSGSSTKCTKKVTTTKTISATIKSYSYSCPTGYNSSGSGSSLKCRKEVFSISAAKIKYYYSCPTGYTLDGYSCKARDKEINANKNVKYSCPEGYNKLGNGSSTVCVKKGTKYISATKNVNEVTKWRYKWSSATSLAGWTATGRTRTVSSK